MHHLGIYEADKMLKKNQNKKDREHTIERKKKK